MKQHRFLHKLADYAVLTGTGIIVPVIIHFFQLPNRFVFGGVTGLALLLSSITPISFTTYNLCINVGLLILGFLCLGRSFGLRTVYVTLLISFSFELLDWLAPVRAPLTDQPFLEMLIVTVAIACTSALLFQKGASGGGTDIAAMVLRKYVRIDIGKALLLVDSIAVLFTFPLYGLTIGLFSVVGLLAKSFVVDNFIESINLCKYFTIVCDKPEEICDYIRYDLIRGATVYRAQGVYSHETKSVILVAVSRSQAILLRNFVRMHAPDAFLVITNSSEIVGKGFLLE